MNEDMQIAKAATHVRAMLDDRGIRGDELTIDDVHDCPGLLWGVQRGSTAVFVVRNINKGSIRSLFEFCQPPASVEEPEPHPHAGNDIKHAIVIYVEKCTTMACKEMDACTLLKAERFKLDEILMFPLIFGYVGGCRVLRSDEADALRARVPLDKLPKIWVNDPMQRYFNAGVGDVYRIEEKYGALQPEVVYRVVTEQSC